MARWREYVPVRQRRADAERHARDSARRGEALAPVVPKDRGRAIAKTVWGRAWCENLERYRDFENRLPRGRTYVRNGSVIDLKASAGEIHALVQGSERYRVQVRLTKIAKKRWSALTRACGAEIGTLVELLEGRISKSVMAIMTERGAGLFPDPREIDMVCSCPDWASMCKHIAAVLYGIGIRLDDSPRLLFELRGVDPAELVASAGIAAIAPPASKDVLTGNLEDIFGIELDAGAPAPIRKNAPRARKTSARSEGTPKGNGKATRRKPKRKTKKTTTRRGEARA